MPFHVLNQMFVFVFLLCVVGYLKQHVARE